MASGIVGWGTYLPYWRLDRKAIGLALGQPVGPGDPHGGVLRRGSDHDGRGSGPPGAGCRRGADPRGGPVLHARAALPRQDQRRRHPRRPRPAGAGRRLRPVRVGPLRAPWPCGRRPPWSRPAGAGGDRPTCAPGWPAGPTSATRATARRPSCGGPRAPWPRPSASRRPPRSSSTGGGSRARTTRDSGRSASARTCTSRWPRPPSPTRSKAAGIAGRRASITSSSPGSTPVRSKRSGRRSAPGRKRRCRI